MARNSPALRRLPQRNFLLSFGRWDALEYPITFAGSDSVDARPAMTTPPVRVERRVGQRFPYLLPVSLGDSSSRLQASGCTQDLSSRGVFLFTDAALAVGGEIELTLRMPSEITLGESMRVCCRGRVLRVVEPPANSGQNSMGRDASGPRLGIAVRFDSYEYLSEPAESGARAPRMAALHPHEEETGPVEPAGTRGIQG